MLVLLLRLLLRTAEPMTLEGNLRSTSSTSHKIAMHIAINRNLNRLGDRELALMGGSWGLVDVTAGA